MKNCFAVFIVLAVAVLPMNPTPIPPTDEQTYEAKNWVSGEGAIYSVSVSRDGVHWGSPIATGSGPLGITAITFPAQTARYIRIMQTGVDPTYHGSIYELDVRLEKSS